MNESESPAAAGERESGYDGAASGPLGDDEGEVLGEAETSGRRTLRQMRGGKTISFLVGGVAWRRGRCGGCWLLWRWLPCGWCRASGAMH